MEYYGYGIESLSKKINRSIDKSVDVANQTMKEIRGDILRLSYELNISSSARDRIKVENEIKKKTKKLNERLSEIEESILFLSSQKAVKDFGKQSGLDVHFSKKQAMEIIDLVDGKENQLAAVFTDKMEKSVIMTLRKATLSAIQESALRGMTRQERMKVTQEKWEKSTHELGKKAEFIDISGKKWDTKRYFQMNIRTNSTRVYNAQFSSNMTENGFDLVRVSWGGDAQCDLCFPWEGRIVSLTGKTKGFPTVDQAKEHGLFHPNCTHSLLYVDPTTHAKEIELQSHFKPLGKKADEEDLYDQKEQIDIARKMQDGKIKDYDKAKMLVKRDYLVNSIMDGLSATNAQSVVDQLSDGEINKLFEKGRAPEFFPTKRGETSSWNKGSKGGAIHIKRSGFSADKLRDACGLKDDKDE